MLTPWTTNETCEYFLCYKWRGDVPYAVVGGKLRKPLQEGKTHMFALAHSTLLQKVVLGHMLFLHHSCQEEGIEMSLHGACAG